MELNKAKTAIITLGVLGVVWQFLGSPPTEVLTSIVVAVSGLGGFELRGQVEEMRRTGTRTIGVPKIKWKKYYFRVIGYFLCGGGGALIFDELIHGPLSFWPLPQHEAYGVVLFLIGLGLISLKPHGKN